MEAIVKQSALNPLATCFVPSNFNNPKHLTSTKKKYVDKAKKSKGPNVKSSNVVKFKAAKNLKEKDIKFDVLLSYPLVNGVFNLKHVNENLYFGKDGINFEIFKPNSISWTKMDITVFLKLLMLVLFRFYPRQNYLTCDIDDHDGTSDALEENSVSKECCCPPMFGCIIPPEFFGNPFKLNTGCNKKFVHVCNYPNGKRNYKNDAHERNQENKYLKDAKGGKTKLEQYSFALEEIVSDICEIVSLYEETDHENHPNKDGHCTNESLEETNPDNEIKVISEESEVLVEPKILTRPDHSNLENLVIEMEIPKDTPIITDDDFHPLLDEGISMLDSDDEEVSREIKMIEINFSPTRKEGRLSFDPEELPEKTICNPPCSVWCDGLPQSAKDTYRKFIKSLPEEDKELSKFVSSENNLQKPMFTKPLYKRSLSANDCLKSNENLVQFQSSFDPQSMNMLENPSIDFKFSDLNRTLKDAKRTQSLSLNGKSFHFLNEMALSNSHYEDGMWGPFDGEDSLWQSLPDCVPSNGNAKQSAHKRVRELRRQKSLN